MHRDRAGNVVKFGKASVVSHASKPYLSAPSRASWSRPKGEKLARPGFSFSSAFVVIMIVLGAGHDFAIAAAFNLMGCDIKGNISKNSGEKIFHVPGQEYYSPTIINHLKGERWFCTEADARAAGWRKAGR